MKKLGKVYLHVGSDKTGSTSIQNILQSNRQKLSEYGYIYPEGFHHYLVATYFSHQPLELDYFRVRKSEYDPERVKLDASRYIDTLAARINQGTEPNLILSYEGFTGLTSEEFVELKEFLSRFTEHIEVIYYMRPPISYAPSAISERVRFGARGWHIHPPVTYYMPRLLVLKQVFGEDNLTLRNFDRESLVGGDVVADFFSLVQLPSQLCKQLNKQGEKFSNLALSETAITIGDEMIRLLDDAGPKGADFNKCFSTTLEKIKGGKYQLTQFQQEVIKRATANDVASIRSEFGVDISDRKIAPTRTQSSRMSRETACSLARVIIESQLPEIKLEVSEKVEDYHSEGEIRKASGKLLCDENLPLVMDTGNEYKVRVILQNRSKVHWGGSVAPVKASYHWLSDRRKKLDYEEQRTLLPETGVAPGSDLRMEVDIMSPQQQGDYFLELTLLQEYFNWFENIGFDSAVVPVRVVSKVLPEH